MRTSKIFTGTAMIVAVLLISAGLALAAPPAGVGVNGQAGNSDVYHCDLLSSLDDGPRDAYGHGEVHAKVGDGSVRYTVNVGGLMPGMEYELRSGGPFDPPVRAVANGGGNLTVVGTSSTWGPHFNVWEVGSPDSRILRTVRNCVPTT